MSWLLLVSFLAGIYFFFLAGFQLFQSGKKFSQAAKRTGELLTDLADYQKVDPEPAKAVSSADLQQTLQARRRLVKQRIRRREDRQRRLVNRIREIDLDKRWS
jgi:uncharacterized membrane-anchored protein YhcB (DUF1043 family)